MKCSKCGEDMQEVFSNFFCDCDVLPEFEDEGETLDPEIIQWISNRPRE